MPETTTSFEDFEGGTPGEPIPEGPDEFFSYTGGAVYTSSPARGSLSAGAPDVYTDGYVRFEKRQPAQLYTLESLYDEYVSIGFIDPDEMSISQFADLLIAAYGSVQAALDLINAEGIGPQVRIYETDWDFYVVDPNTDEYSSAETIFLTRLWGPDNTPLWDVRIETRVQALSPHANIAITITNVATLDTFLYASAFADAELNVDRWLRGFCFYFENEGEAQFIVGVSGYTNTVPPIVGGPEGVPIPTWGEPLHVVLPVPVGSYMNLLDFKVRRYEPDPGDLVNVIYLDNVRVVHDVIGGAEPELGNLMVFTGAGWVPLSEGGKVLTGEGWQDWGSIGKTLTNEGWLS